eukprot:5638534-Pyramimonas_sp.AAC.1
MREEKGKTAVVITRPCVCLGVLEDEEGPVEGSGRPLVCSGRKDIPLSVRWAHYARGSGARWPVGPSYAQMFSL